MPNRNTDIEKAKKLSRRFKRNNLIRMVKQYSIDNQLIDPKYEISIIISFYPNK